MVLRVACITVSDSCANLSREDRSGPVLQKCLKELNEPVTILAEVIPDDFHRLKHCFVSLCDHGACDVIITTGGTGFSQRDVTPDATKAVLDREAPGLVQAIMNRSLQATPFAALSRLTCGIRKNTWIINFPGSPNAVQECFEVVAPILRHAVDIVRDNTIPIRAAHEKMQLPISKVDIAQSIVSRPRQSSFPKISVSDAIDNIMKELPDPHIITVDFCDALGYVLAQDVVATDPHPPFPASIKDGYAVLASDGAGHRRVRGAVTAGSEEVVNLESGFCMRISTGAALPPGADAVVQVEDTELLETTDEGTDEAVINIQVTPRCGQDIRNVGSDIALGETVLRSGQLLKSADIGMLAAVGCTRVKVFAKPAVTVMSTGNELLDPNAALQYGKIRDSNRPMMRALLFEQGFSSTDGGVAPDVADTLLQALLRAFEQCDILVTSGGVSMGEKDLLKNVLVTDLNFDVRFGRVFMKPGFTATSYYLTSVAIIVYEFSPYGTGNPVSAWVTSQLYVIPALRKISGYVSPLPTVIKVKTMEQIKLDPRPEYHRAVFVPPKNDADTMPLAISTGSNQMSSRLLSTKDANLLLRLPAKSDDLQRIEAGDVVEALVVGSI